MENNPWWKGPNGEWYVVVQILLFGILFIIPFLGQTPEWPAPFNRIAQILGLILALLGVGIAFWGVNSLGRNLTAVPKPKQNAQMVQQGAYRLVRHPIYSGVILAGFGWSLLNNSLLALLVAVILFIFFDIKSRKEEGWLVEKYENYAVYQRQVKKLIPFVY